MLSQNKNEPRFSSVDFSLGDCIEITKRDGCTVDGTVEEIHEDHIVVETGHYEPQDVRYDDIVSAERFVVVNAAQYQPVVPKGVEVNNEN